MTTFSFKQNLCFSTLFFVCSQALAQMPGTPGSPLLPQNPREQMRSEMKPLVATEAVQELSKTKDAAASVVPPSNQKEAIEEEFVLWRRSQEGGSHHEKSWRGRGFFIGLHFIDSEWSKLGGNLVNGSTLFELGWAREVLPEFEGALQLAFSLPSSTNSYEDNLSAAHFAIEGRYFFLPGTFRPFVGMGLGVGYYRAWPRSLETSSFVSYSKLAQGPLFGLLPSLGLRTRVSRRFSADLAISYTGYVDNPQYRLGGWTAGFRLNMQR